MARRDARASARAAGAASRRPTSRCSTASVPAASGPTSTPRPGAAVRAGRDWGPHAPRRARAPRARPPQTASAARRRRPTSPPAARRRAEGGACAPCAPTSSCCTTRSSSRSTSSPARARSAPTPSPSATARATWRPRRLPGPSRVYAHAPASLAAAFGPSRGRHDVRRRHDVADFSRLATMPLRLSVRQTFHHENRRAPSRPWAVCRTARLGRKACSSSRRRRRAGEEPSP